MPELPEVETICSDLRQDIKGLSILEVKVLDPRVVRGLSAAAFARKLAGRRILGAERRSKAILLDLDGQFLIVQPMMTGQLIVSNSEAADSLVKATKIVFRLSKNKVLLYNDQRLFGRLTVVRDPEESEYVKALGPEPLVKDFSAEKLRLQLVGRRAPIKISLLDGTCVAGIGNIYASEILFCAGILPMRPADDLKDAEIDRLWKAMRQVLAEAIRLRGTSMRNYRDGRGQEGRYLTKVKVYDRGGEPCRDCGTEIRRIVQAQRSTYYCSRCQK